MTDEFEAERKFLRKNYQAFLYNYIQDFKHSNDPLHLHPPPALHEVYKLVLRPYIMQDDELCYTDLITMMDMVAKFMSYLNHNGIQYDGFSSCSCTRLTDRDMELLLESGGENR